MGHPINFYFSEGNDVLPSVSVVTDPAYTVMVIDGTATFQEFAMQAFNGVVPPTNYGILGTLPLWYQWSQWATSAAIAAGANPNAPIMIVGHSAGGATAAVVAARYRHGIPNREIKYLTFASPKAMDARGTALLNRCEGIAIANIDDPVTAIPPNLVLFDPFRPLYPLLNMNPWALWHRDPRQVVMNEDGDLNVNQTPILDFVTMGQFIFNVVNHLEFPTFNEHRTGGYLARTLRRCPQGGWPLPPDFPPIIIEGGFVAFNDLVIPPFVGGGAELTGDCYSPIWMVDYCGISCGDCSPVGPGTWFYDQEPFPLLSTHWLCVDCPAYELRFLNPGTDLIYDPLRDDYYQDGHDGHAAKIHPDCLLVHPPLGTLLLSGGGLVGSGDAGL